MENRDTRRRFEKWGKNPGCEANAVSAILGVSMVEVGRPDITGRGHHQHLTFWGSLEAQNRIVHL